ncbi:LOW QUALITY PROTEIN: coiled-coil domain-containing protein 18 [Aplochiton taeniatus]
MSTNEESLVEDVATLRDQLRLTEISLQSVGEQLSLSGEHGSLDERYGQQTAGKPRDGLAGRLTLEDLQTPDVLQSQSNDPTFERIPSFTTDLRACESLPNARPASGRSRSMEVQMEPAPLRKKLGFLRQENACLAMQNQQLVSDLEQTQLELATTKTKIRVLGSTVGLKTANVTVMREQLLGWRPRCEGQAKELRARQAAVLSDRQVIQLRDELCQVRTELAEKSRLGKRAEQQRNQALVNAEKLQEAFKEYKINISIKLKTVMENESKQESLIECDREREELECNNVRLKEETVQARTLTAERSDLQTRLEEAGRRASSLERELRERAVEAREMGALHREVEDLRALAQSQEHRVAQSQREAQQSQAELASLEAILALLHLREGNDGPMCVKPCALPLVDNAGTAELLKTKPGERYQQLLPVLQALEAERTGHSALAQRLQERLSRAQEEISSLQTSMTQRASHYQSLHSDLLEKLSQAGDAEKELKRKSARVCALEKQLQEKTSAYTQTALKNAEMEKLLMEKTSSIQHYQAVISKKQREFQLAVARSEKDHAVQCHHLQDTLELVRHSLEQAKDRELELDQEHKEELCSCLLRSKEVKQKYQSQLEAKTNQLSSLQDNLASATLLHRTSTEQNLQLQVTLQQQQGMLQEGGRHIAELEENQSLLQTQVSGLEQELERARASLQEELLRREKEVEEAQQDVEEMNTRTTQLSGSVTQLTTEMSRCRGELSSMEKELQTLRKEASSKSLQISRMEQDLQHAQQLLDKKSDMVLDLEEKLHRSEADRCNSVQQAQAVEGQLEVVRGELGGTLEHLQELRDVLERTQLTADQRQLSLEKLSSELRQSQRELEDRNHEVLDLDTALKERQGELQQRAQLLGQLDVAIKDHKLEMEKKMVSLQDVLQTREKELRDRDWELKDRDKKEQLLQLQVCREKLKKSAVELQETHTRNESLARELEALRQQAKEKEVRLRTVKEELRGKEALWAQEKGRLLAAVTSLQQEQEQEREQHSMELSSLQQTRGQLLKVSEQISCSMKSSQEHLTSKLQQSQSQLDLARVQYDQSQNQAEQLQLQLDQSQNQAEQLQLQLDQSRNRAEQLQLQLEQSRTQASHLGVQLQPTRTQDSQFGGQLEQVRAQLDQSKGQASHLAVQLEQTKGQASHLSLQLEQVRAELDQSKGQASHLGLQLEQVRAQLDQSKGPASHLVLQLEQVRTELDQSKGQASHLAVQLEQTKGQASHLSLQLEQVRAELDQSKGQASHLGLQLEQVRAQLDQSKGPASHLGLQLEQLRAQLDQSKGPASPLGLQLEQVGAELDQSKDQASHLAVQVEQTKGHASHLGLQLEQVRAQLDQSKGRASHLAVQLEQTKGQASHLGLQLEQVRAQLDQSVTQAALLQAQLHSAEKALQSSDEAMVIKESEVARLQARISSLERASDLHHSTLPTSPLPPHTHTHSAPLPPATQHAANPLPLPDLGPTQAPCGWLAGMERQPESSVESSLDLSGGLKATLRDALAQQQHLPWGSSPHHLPPGLHEEAGPDHSWQGLGLMESTVASDLSFNPLTYMVDKLEEEEEEEGDPQREGSQDLEEGQERDPRREAILGHAQDEGEVGGDMSSLTGMLRFVNQTLAMQEDTTLWSSTALPENRHPDLTLQRDSTEMEN